MFDTGKHRADIIFINNDADEHIQKLIHHKFTKYEQRQKLPGRFLIQTELNLALSISNKNWMQNTNYFHYWSQKPSEAFG